MGCCKNNKCVSKETLTDVEKKYCKKCTGDKKCQKHKSFSNVNLDYYQKYLKYKSKYISKKISQSGGTHPLSKWTYQDGKIVKGVKDVKGVIVNEGPVFIYNKLVEEYGKPDISINKKKGICIWYLDNRADDIHHSIELRDQYVEHCVPANHHDFLYSYINIYIPPNRLEEVMKVSGSIGYDGLQKLLYARCASLEANAATLAAVIKVINGTDVDYSDHIINRYKSYDENVKFIKENLEQDRKKNSDKYDQPYSDLAFPTGCDN